VPCRERGILADAVVLHRAPWKNFVRRLARDLAERRKPPLTLWRRGRLLMHAEPAMVATAEAKGCRRVDAIGLGLGLGAGIAPGPLQALVVTVTLARGFAAGARVALSPLLSDLVVVVVSVLVVGSLPDRATAVLGVLGGLFVIWLGIEALRDVSVPLEGEPHGEGGSLLRGALVNLLSPHPWLFWLTVGGPLLAAAWAESAAAAVGFLVGFYLLLVGSKVVLAALVAAGRRHLSPTGLRRAHRAAGVLLLATGLLLLVEFSRALLP
jgi:threonine/homoserine/homoserine lactone efflux protein